MTKTDSTGTLHYIYNNDGNQLDEVRDGSVAGPILYRYLYDDNGNRTEKRYGADFVLQSYTYDQKNRVTSLTTQADTHYFDYDSNDYRMSKLDSGGTRVYLLEGEHLEAVYDEAAQIQAKYLRGVVVDEIVNGYYYDDQAKKTNYTFHHDHLRSVVGLTAHEGSTVETTKYGAFGEEISGSGTSDNFLKYTGREHDEELGLYYYRARFYDPGVGRFLSEDPLGFEAGINFYAYVDNNPVNFNDPDGLWTLSFGVSGGMGAIFGGGGGTFLNVGHDPSKSLTSGWSFSLTGTAEAGALGGAGGSVQFQAMVTNAKDVNQLNSPFLVVGKSAGAGIIGGGEWVSGAGDVNGLSLYGGLGLRSTYATPVTTYVSGSTTSAMYQYSNGVHSFGNTGQGSIWSSNPQTVQSNTGGANGPAGSGGSPAAGGYVIYPNKPNTNMMQSVYSK